MALQDGPKSVAGLLLLRGLPGLTALLLMAGVVVFFAHTIAQVEQHANVFPLDSYYYQSFAANIQRGNGPCAEWPQGPQNKYFPGFAYWWAAFLPRDMAPDDAIRNYHLPQTVLLVLLMVALTALGRAIWRDWSVALCYAALGASAPVVLKWGFVPLSELLATVCIAGIAAAAAALSDMASAASADAAPTGRGRPAATRRRIALAAMGVLGAVGLATRVEVAYVLGALILALIVCRRIHWRVGVMVLLVSASPLAVWQLWVTQRFHEPTYYLGEGTHAFQLDNVFGLFFFQMLNFLRVQSVSGPSATVDGITLVSYLLFMCTLILALRGYTGRFACFSAWFLLVYWGLHSLWYYQTERYNLLVAPFGFVVFVEGLGRLYNARKSWFARGGRYALAILCLVMVPVFCGHASDNIWRMVRAFNQQKRFPDNRNAILQALRGEKASNRRMVFLTNLSLPEARRLPGVVWLDPAVLANDICSDRLSPIYAPGQAAGFMAKAGVTHLVLRPPIDSWIAANARGLPVKEIYSDDMVWIGRVER